MSDDVIHENRVTSTMPAEDGVCRIRLVPGDVTPRAHELGRPGSEFEQVRLHEVVVTEEATRGGWPSVDFVCEDASGKTLLLTLTGGHVNMISAAVRGVNMRVHGREEQ